MAAWAKSVSRSTGPAAITRSARAIGKSRCSSKHASAAGDLALGRELLEFVEPLIYSTTLDFRAVEAVSEARERISEKLAAKRPHAGLDIKLAPGGIRDIEFLVQCLQRLHGGRELWVRHGGTLFALSRVHDKNLLSASEYARLASAYEFLRHIEHRLQFYDDRQTHTLPTNPEELDVLARKMPAEIGDPLTADALQVRLEEHLGNVREMYARVIQARKPMYYIPVEGELDDRWKPIDLELPPAAPTNLTLYLEQRAPRLAAVLARAKLNRGRERFELFLEKISEDAGWLARLDADSKLVESLVDIFEHSQYFGDQLLRHPEMVAELDSSAPPPPADLPHEAIADSASLRAYFRRQMFRIQSDSVLRPAPIFETLERTSDLADAVIAAAYHIALGEAPRPAHPEYVPARQMMVVSLGRLGMREFDLASDADLIFVIPDEDAPEQVFWTAVAERMINVISAYTGDGVMFTVDTRLRPNGREGALVQPEATYREYFARHAEAWEGIAYMKSRAVAGNPERATEFLHKLQELDWRRYGQGGRSRKELAQMRARLEKEQGSRNPLKAAIGGYYDIDFALMYLRLRGAGIFYKVLNTPARIDVIEQMGHLEREDADFLRDAAVFYRAIDHGLRVSSGYAGGHLPTSPSQSETARGPGPPLDSRPVARSAARSEARRDPPEDAGILQPRLRSLANCGKSQETACARARLSNMPRLTEPRPSESGSPKIMNRPYVRRAFHLLGAVVIVALVIAFYFRVVSVNNTTVALTLLLVIFGISTAWGLLEATVASVAAVLGFNYYFLPPVGTFEVQDPQNWVALTAFLITAVMASQLSVRAKRRTQEAVSRRREVEGLYALSQSLLLSGSARTASQDLVSRVVKILGVTQRRLPLAAESETFRWGPDDPLISDEQLQADRDEPLIDRSRGLAIVPVRLGGQALGNLGLSRTFALRRGPECRRLPGRHRRSNAHGRSKKPAAPKRRARAKYSNPLCWTRWRTIFKTPLTSIKAAITSLLGQPRSDPDRELMTIIHEEADRLNRLVAEVIEMVRIEAGQLHLEKGPQDVGEIIGSTVAELKPQLQDRLVEVRLQDDLPVADADFDFVRQALRQLLDNALKYSPPGSPLTISARAGEGRIVISVADRGAGIDEQEQLRIFDKFFRAREHRFRVPGTGMGLAIAKGIVEAHGGKIWVTSEPGQGPYSVSRCLCTVVKWFSERRKNSGCGRRPADPPRDAGHPDRA